MSDALSTLQPYAIIALAVALYGAYALYRAFNFDHPGQSPRKAEKIADGPFTYPGYIAYKDSHGCYFAHIRNARELNRYFSPNHAGWNKAIVEIIPIADGSFGVVYTEALTDDQKQDLTEWSYERHAYFEEKRQERIKQREEEAKKKQQEEKERNHYAEIGRKYVKDRNAIKLMAPGSKEREEAEKKLNKGELNE